MKLSEVVKALEEGKVIWENVGGLKVYYSFYKGFDDCIFSICRIGKDHPTMSNLLSLNLNSEYGIVEEQ